MERQPRECIVCWETFTPSCERQETCTGCGKRAAYAGLQRGWREFNPVYDESFYDHSGDAERRFRVRTWDVFRRMEEPAIYDRILRVMQLRDSA